LAVKGPLSTDCSSANILNIVRQLPTIKTISCHFFFVVVLVNFTVSFSFYFFKSQFYSHFVSDVVSGKENEWKKSQQNRD